MRSPLRWFQGIQPSKDHQSQPRPLKVSWIIPGQLAVGRLPRSGEGDILAQENIRSVLSLCAPSEGNLPDEITQNFRCLRFILPDSDYLVSLQVRHLAEVVNLIHRQIENQEPVYVHCLAGIERSPTACIAYLCQHQQVELWEAINYVRQVHPRAMPSEAHIQVVRELVEKGKQETTEEHRWG